MRCSEKQMRFQAKYLQYFTFLSEICFFFFMFSKLKHQFLEKICKTFAFFVQFLQDVHSFVHFIFGICKFCMFLHKTLFLYDCFRDFAKSNISCGCECLCTTKHPICFTTPSFLRIHSSKDKCGRDVKGECGMR